MTSGDKTINKDIKKIFNIRSKMNKELWELHLQTKKEAQHDTITNILKINEIKHDYITKILVQICKKFKEDFRAWIPIDTLNPLQNFAVAVHNEVENHLKLLEKDWEETEVHFEAFKYVYPALKRDFIQQFNYVLKKEISDKIPFESNFCLTKTYNLIKNETEETQIKILLLVFYVSLSSQIISQSNACLEMIKNRSVVKKRKKLTNDEIRLLRSLSLNPDMHTVAFLKKTFPTDNRGKATNILKKLVRYGYVGRKEKKRDVEKGNNYGGRSPIINYLTERGKRVILGLGKEVVIGYKDYA